ncbi:MAG: DNA repair protein RadA [Bacillota bacterium]|nr:DNA repair protein RadA [Bacillota bacterium]
MAAKSKTVFVCNECGYESAKWLGRCTSCGAWNTFTEHKITNQTKGISQERAMSALPKVSKLSEVSITEEQRISCKIGELDRVLGGGLVEGSLVLVGGDPGIGKSTLLLQTAQNLSGNVNVLYVSGEESEKQIKMRAQRLSANKNDINLYCETNVDKILNAAEEVKPRVMIVDSIQTIYSEDISSVPGSVSQVRECCMMLMRYAKQSGTAVFIVGHVTKEGTIAGPRILEHMVDCVLYFEGECHQSYRILRAVKNRFGSTDEIGVFEMESDGLHEVENPSMALLMGRPKDTPGSAVVCTIEGTRPILAEVQALVAPAGYGTPRRMGTGIDYNRMVMLIAVMEKRIGLNLQNMDVYINVAGGLKITEPAADLAIVTAVVSAYRGIPLPDDTVAIGETGLTGEIRSVSQIDKRLAELAKMGFKRCIVPKGKEIRKGEGIEVETAENLANVIKFYFGKRGGKEE